MTTSATTSHGSRRKRCERQIFTPKWALCIYIQNFRFANHPRKCTAMVMVTGAEEGVTEEERKEMGEEAGGVVGEGMGEEEEVVVVEEAGRTEEERKGEVGGKRERVEKDLVG